MTTEVYRVLSFKASLLLLASKPLKWYIHFTKVRYCLKVQTPMTKEVYRVLSFKASLLLLASKPLNPTREEFV